MDSYACPDKKEEIEQKTLIENIQNWCNFLGKGTDCLHFLEFEVLLLWYVVTAAKLVGYLYQISTQRCVMYIDTKPRDNKCLKLVKTCFRENIFFFKKCRKFEFWILSLNFSFFFEFWVFSPMRFFSNGQKRSLVYSCQSSY